MPITPFLNNQAFDPDTIEAMGEACAPTPYEAHFSAVCIIIGKIAS
jgi:hypothetical protein